VTQEGRIPFYNFHSDEERRLFTTKPKEITTLAARSAHSRIDLLGKAARIS
jgi:hypothetical protein